jgi:hypothetical protein
MAKWNAYKRVLNHEHTRFWRFKLLDVDEPNLQNEVFPYDEVSRFDFDHRIFPIQPAEEILITDTTFRERTEGHGRHIQFSQIVGSIRMMSQLGKEEKGIIRQTEFFLLSATGTRKPVPAVP